MATNRRLMRGLTSGDVWAALRDGKSYGDWVVGTRGIRDVDAGWPDPPARLHYTVGYRPLRKDSITQSLVHEPGRTLVMRAHAWPAGSARIQIEVRETGEGVEVTIVEHPDAGPAKLLHNPVADLAIKVRNVETLRRLERVSRQARG